MRDRPKSDELASEGSRDEGVSIDEPRGPVQLGLFTPETEEVEAGFAALGRLDLSGAESVFAGMHRRCPDTEDAACGLAAVAHWRAVLSEVDLLPPPERAAALWRAVRECPREIITRTLRRRVLEDVLETLRMQAEVLPRCELCVADVLLALRRTGSARRWLDWAIRADPECARLQLLHGDALHEVSAGAARSCYSRGLLLDPTLERWKEVAWRELAVRVAEVGGAATALDWWAAGRLPLPPPQTVGEPHPSLADAWRALAHAETERLRGRHEEMIRHRARLRVLAPDVLARYIDRLEM